MKIKYFTLGSIFALSVILIFSSMSFAEKKTSEMITGKVICLGCDLKKSEGAAADCKTYGHKHGFKTIDGAIYTFLENKKSEKFIGSKEYAGKMVTIHGRILNKTHIIEVDKVTLTDEKAGEMSAVCTMCSQDPCVCPPCKFKK